MVFESPLYSERKFRYNGINIILRLLTKTEFIRYSLIGPQV